MPDDSLTHKDLSAMTGVSETTIKSYRRKFAEFFSLRSRGKPLRFAPESARVCKRIRQCFEKDLCVEEIRLLLATEFPHLRQQERAAGNTAAGQRTPGAGREPEQNDPPRDSRQLATALQQQHQAFDILIDKCSKLAAAQEETNLRLLKLQESFTDFLSLFLAREDLLGRGLESLNTQLGTHLQHAETGLQALAQEIGSGLAALRTALPPVPEHKSVLVRNSFGESTRYVFQSQTGNPGTGPAASGQRAAEEAATTKKTAPSEPAPSGEPPADFLSAPLVVRSNAGEYLGIAGRSEGAFCLHDFIALLRKSYPPPQHFSLEWRAQQTGWLLQAEQAEAIRPIKYALYLEPSTTPKGNAVAVLQRLDRNGREQPGPHLYTFIRRMRAMVAAASS